MQVKDTAVVSGPALNNRAVGERSGAGREATPPPVLEPAAVFEAGGSIAGPVLLPEQPKPMGSEQLYSKFRSFLCSKPTTKLDEGLNF